MKIHKTKISGREAKEENELLTKKRANKWDRESEPSEIE